MSVREFPVIKLLFCPMAVFGFGIFESLRESSFAENSEVFFTHMFIFFEFVRLDFDPIVEILRTVLKKPKQFLF